MKSIKKRFAKVKIVSRVTQFEENGGATFTDKEALDTNTECTTLTTDCTIADKGGRGKDQGRHRQSLSRAYQHLA